MTTTTGHPEAFPDVPRCEDLWPVEAIREVSFAWEAATGCDSIDTIERLYYQTSGGAFLCCWPDCQFARRDSITLWRHVHTAHGQNDLPPGNFDWGVYL